VAVWFLGDSQAWFRVLLLAAPILGVTLCKEFTVKRVLTSFVAAGALFLGAFAMTAVVSSPADAQAVGPVVVGASLDQFDESRAEWQGEMEASRAERQAEADTRRAEWQAEMEASGVECPGDCGQATADRQAEAGTYGAERRAEAAQRRAERHAEMEAGGIDCSDDWAERQAERQADAETRRAERQMQRGNA
jgi:type IV secretory pathway TrbL component